MPATLLERSAPLNEAKHALERLQAGESGVLVVMGEAGVGKSSLLRAALAAAPPGIRVLRGACDDLVAANPLGPVREATVGLPVAAVIEAGRPEGVPVALAELFAGPPPTVLAVEDLHWADDATIDVLAYLARRIDRLRLLLLVTLRDDEVAAEHPAERFLAVATGERVQRLRLAPLQRASVAQLSAGSGWDSRLLHEITGGNPFYLTETLAAPADAPVPSSVSDAVMARLRRLSDRTRHAVKIISVWPGLLDFGLAEDLLDGEIDSLAEAEALGVLTVSDDGISFRHELARLATEASLDGLRRRRLRAEVMRALRARGEPDLPRLVHFASLCGDARTLAEFAPRAGEQSARLGAHRQALIFYRSALDQERLLPEATLAGVLDEYAWELYNAQRFDDAVRAATRAADLWHRLGRPAAEATVRGRLSRHLFMAGETDAAQRCAASAVELTAGAGAAASGTAEVAAAEVALGALLALDVEATGAIEQLQVAERHAREAGRADLVALVRNYQSLARPDLSAVERVGLLRDSIELSMSNGAHEFEARGYTNLTELLFRYGRYAELAADLDGWMELTRDRGFTSHSFNLEVHAALLAQRTGRPDEAEDALAQLAARYSDPGMLAVYVVPTYGRLLARRGAPGAEEMLHESWDRARRQRLLIGLGFAGTALLDWAWLHDDRDTALDVVSVWAGYADRPTAGPYWEEIRRYARDVGIETPPGPASGSADPWDVGLAGEWARAAAEWDRIGDGYEAARELGGSGDVEAMLEAVARFEDVGAVAAARRVRSRLADLGVRSIRRGPSAATRRNPGGLTNRQVDVAELLADGLTNAEMAERLYLSVRTVDAHVSAVLAKLGVSRRNDIAKIVRSWSANDR